MNCACRVLFISRQWLCVQAGASAWPCCTNVFLEGFVSLDLDEQSCIFESTPLSPHWKGSEMDLWVSNQSLGHLSPRCKTTVCKLSQLNKLLGERETGNWRRPGASLLSQLRGHCGSREETVWLPYVPSTADGEVISATLFLQKKNRNQKWDVKKSRLLSVQLQDWGGTGEQVHSQRISGVIHELMSKGFHLFGEVRWEFIAEPLTDF